MTIRQAMSQQKRTAYKGFEINLVATLRLPQIESPGEATKVKGDLELVELSKTNVSNGHICIDTHVHFLPGQNGICTVKKFLMTLDVVFFTEEFFERNNHEIPVA